MKKSHRKADTIWSADIVRSGGSAELLIVDEKSGRAIVRTPVDVTDVTSGIGALKEAFETVGTPLEIRTDAGLFFTRHGGKGPSHFARGRPPRGRRRSQPG